MLKTAQEIAIGGLLTQADTSQQYKTGSWASKQPHIIPDKCTGCSFCFNYCPEDCITMNTEGKVADINKDFCKGCGICVKVCKFGALVME
jgi:pyruvate ferredoxin oxidoreductase delta subunit